ncbi:DUF4190 domain-containing protein [Leucobacter sp. GX24907]
MSTTITTAHPTETAAASANAPEGNLQNTTALQDAQVAPVPPERSDYRGFAITSFVLGLVSIAAGWTFFAPLTGLILGILALRGGTSERTLTTWGIALNGAMLALFALGLVAVVVFAAFGLMALPFIA